MYSPTYYIKHINFELLNNTCVANDWCYYFKKNLIKIISDKK